MSDLIELIIDKTKKVPTQLTDFPELNVHLQAKSNASRWFNKVFNGLGSSYSELKPHLLINTDTDTTGIISELQNVSGILQLAESFNKKSLENRESAKKYAFKAGICFALVAAYAEKMDDKKTAYESLVRLFSPAGYLGNPKLYDYCRDKLKPIATNGTFYAEHHILWSWQLAGAKGVFAFEEQRQTAIMSFSNMNVDRALTLLGLEESTLNNAEIDNRFSKFATTLRAVSGLDKKSSMSSEKYKQLQAVFRQAADKLTSYSQFKNFSWSEHNRKLREAVDKIALISWHKEKDTAVFSDALKLFKAAHRDVQSVVSIANNDKDSYVTGGLVKKQLGILVLGNKYNVEYELTDLAKEFWQRILSEIVRLIDRALRLQQSYNVSISKFITESTLICDQMEVAIAMLSQIRGDATDESYILSEVASGVEDKINALTTISSKLKNKCKEYEAEISTDVNTAVRLCKEVQVEVPVAGKRMALLRAYENALTDINKTFDFLNKLQSAPIECEIAEREFNKHIQHQVTVDSVAAAISIKLENIDRVVLEKTFKAMGVRYNAVLGLNQNIVNYLRNKHNQNLGEIASVFIENFKATIYDTQGTKVDIKTKDIVPPATSFSVETVRKILEEKQCSITQSMNVLQAQINDTIRNTLMLYRKIDKERTAIFAERYSLSSIWQSRMDGFQSSNKLCKERSNELLKEFPRNRPRPGYLLKETDFLLNNLQENYDAFERDTAAFQQSFNNARIDVFKYLLLKNYFKIYSQAYVQQGTHHKHRIDSLDSIYSAIDTFNGMDSESRFPKLMGTLREQLNKTAQSHKKIGFLGQYRPCRLQKMYTTILKMADSWKANTENFSAVINTDSIRYSILKHRIQSEISAYKASGRHHSDRIASLKKIADALAVLSNAEYTGTDAFASLLATVREEKKATAESHRRVGFFKRPCRLDVLYTKIIAEAELLQKIAVPATELEEATANAAASMN